MSLTTDVMDRLAELGDTADEVRRTLGDKGITGLPGEPCACPIFNLLEVDGFDVLQVEETDPGVYRIEIEGAYVDVPDPVALFITDFDLHKFPELIDEDGDES